MTELALHHAADLRDRAGRVAELADGGEADTDRHQGIPQFVRQGCDELVFLPVGLPQALFAFAQDALGMFPRKNLLL